VFYEIKTYFHKNVNKNKVRGLKVTSCASGSGKGIKKIMPDMTGRHGIV